MDKRQEGQLMADDLQLRWPLGPGPLTVFLHGDMFDLLPNVGSESVDLVLADLPYGTARCSWDSPVPLNELWEGVLRVLKPRGVAAFTATQPFSSTLVQSNLRMFRYEWIWEKSKATSWMNAKRQPLRAHESVLIFYAKAGSYYPNKTQGSPYTKGTAYRPTAVYGAQIETTVTNTSGLRYPRTVQYFKTAESEGPVLHPTQKPLGLFRYLISTYTHPGDTVLDPCAGVTTAAIAARGLGRHSVSFETDETYFLAGQRRLDSMQEGQDREQEQEEK